MRSALIDAVRTQDPRIMQRFAEPFDHPRKWVARLAEHFARPDGRLSAATVLDRQERWRSARFQALYVACWIYHPLEKGSFMIRLTPQQTANADFSTGEPTWRKSSHLSGETVLPGDPPRPRADRPQAERVLPRRAGRRPRRRAAGSTTPDARTPGGRHARSTTFSQ